MKIHQSKINQIRKFSALIPPIAIVVLAILNYSFRSSVDVEAKQPVDAITAVPNAANKDVAEKGSAIDEMFLINSGASQDTGSMLREGNIVQPLPKSVVATDKSSMDEIATMSAQYNQPIYYPPAQPSYNKARNDGVPQTQVSYPVFDEPVAAPVKKETRIKKVETEGKEVEVDPYAPNGSFTVGGTGAKVGGKTVYNATFMTEKMVEDGDIINIRNAEEIKFNKLRIPVNTLLKGFVSVSGSKMYVVVNLDDYGVDYSLEVSENGKTKGLRVDVTNNTSAADIANGASDAATQVIPAAGIIGRAKSILTGVKGNTTKKNSFFISGGLKVKLILNVED